MGGQKTNSRNSDYQNDENKLPPIVSASSSGFSQNSAGVSTQISSSNKAAVLKFESPSKVGSLQNIKHKPGGGKVQILDRPLTWEAGSKVGSLENRNYTPRESNIHIVNKTLTWNPQAKVPFRQNENHQPQGGDKKIETHKIQWTSLPKINSLENASYHSHGGDKKIEFHKLVWKVQKKVDACIPTYTPPKSEVRIRDEKFVWQGQPKIGSKDNISHQPGGGDKKVEFHKVEWKAEPRTENKNIGYSPRGGDKHLDLARRVSWHADSKVGSLDNVSHKPCKGEVKIFMEATKWNAESRVKSLDNASHKPGGGDKKVEYMVAPKATNKVIKPERSH